MGAAFWGVTIALLVAYRLPDWPQLALLLPVATVTTSLVLVASLLGLDRFHLSSGPVLGMIAAWVWLIVYLVVPLVFAYLWRSELRSGKNRGRSTRTAESDSCAIRREFRLRASRLAVVGPARGLHRTRRSCTGPGFGPTAGVASVATHRERSSCRRRRRRVRTVAPVGRAHLFDRLGRRGGAHRRVCASRSPGRQSSTP